MVRITPEQIARYRELAQIDEAQMTYEEIVEIGFLHHLIKRSEQDAQAEWDQIETENKAEEAALRQAAQAQFAKDNPIQPPPPKTYNLFNEVLGEKKRTNLFLTWCKVVISLAVYFVLGAIPAISLTNHRGEVLPYYESNFPIFFIIFTCTSIVFFVLAGIASFILLLFRPFMGEIPFLSWINGRPLRGVFVKVSFLVVPWFLLGAMTGSTKKDPNAYIPSVATEITQKVALVLVPATGSTGPTGTSTTEPVSASVSGGDAFSIFLYWLIIP